MCEQFILFYLLLPFEVLAVWLSWECTGVCAHVRVQYVVRESLNKVCGYYFAWPLKCLLTRQLV